MSGGGVTILSPRRMTASTARQLTDSIKADTESLWLRLLHAYEQGVHTALGYSSWGDYCQTEFGTGSNYAYRLLDAARVAKAIEEHLPIGKPSNESVARQLVPLLKKKGEKAVADAWIEVVEEHGPEPTAEETHSTVTRRARTPQGKKKKKPTREQEKFGNNLSAMALCAEYIIGTLGGTVSHGASQADRAATKALVDVDEETLALWQNQARVINAALCRLRRHIARKGDAS